MPHVMSKCLIKRDFFGEGVAPGEMPRQTVPITGGQVLPHGKRVSARFSDAIARQVLPPRQIFPGRTCRNAAATHVWKSAIHRAF